jgi:hypothetical protein
MTVLTCCADTVLLRKQLRFLGKREEKREDKESNGKGKT